VTSETKATVPGQIREFVRTRFPLARNLEFTDEDSLLDAGVIDSLGILDLVGFLEETFGIQASDEDLNPENFDSIATLVRFVESKR
jgi:acyl carrier protein